MNKSLNLKTTPNATVRYLSQRWLWEVMWSDDAGKTEEHVDGGIEDDREIALGKIIKAKREAWALADSRRRLVPYFSPPPPYSSSKSSSWFPKGLGKAFEKLFSN